MANSMFLNILPVTPYCGIFCATYVHELSYFQYFAILKGVGVLADAFDPHSTDPSYVHPSYPLVHA